MTPQRRFFGFAIAFLAFAADQASKIFAIHMLDGPERPSVDLLPFLSLTMSWNRGIAYTMLRSDGPAGPLIFALLALLASLLLGFWLWRAQNWAAAAGFGLLIGGALGNALDRLRHGAVADFLYFHTPISLGPLSNYVFNLADAAIFVGVLLLVYDAAFARDHAR